jgi:hypothetical protein
MKTYQDLLEEKARLELTLASKRMLIRQDVEGLKDQFVPISHAIATIVTFFSRDKKNPLVSAGVNFAGDVILKRLILGRTGWLTKMIVPYLVKNYSTHLINKNLNTNGENFLHKLGDRLKGETKASRSNLDKIINNNFSNTTSRINTTL